MLDALIDHFRQAEAWTVAAGAAACCERVWARGMKVVIVSNWDMQLRPLLTSLGVHAFVDAIVVSAEERVVSAEERIEKPEPRLFSRACERVGVAPGAAVHVGDDPDDDVAGAAAAGCAAFCLVGTWLTSTRSRVC